MEKGAQILGDSTSLRIQASTTGCPWQVEDGAFFLAMTPARYLCGDEESAGPRIEKALRQRAFSNRKSCEIRREGRSRRLRSPRRCHGRDVVVGRSHAAAACARAI